MRTLFGALVALALIAAPAGAAQPQLINDPCGDNMAYAWGGGQSASAPGPLSSDFDIESAGFTTVRNAVGDVIGVDLRLQVCGEATSPDHGQSYGWAWDAAGRCVHRMTVGQGLAIGDNKVSSSMHVGFTQSCVKADEPLPIESFETTYSATLPTADRLTIAGDTVTYRLRVADLDPAMRAVVAAGTTWASPRATSEMAAHPFGEIFFKSADAEAGAVVTAGKDYASGPHFTVGG